MSSLKDAIESATGFASDLTVRVFAQQFVLPLLPGTGGAQPSCPPEMSEHFPAVVAEQANEFGVGKPHGKAQLQSPVSHCLDASIQAPGQFGIRHRAEQPLFRRHPAADRRSRRNAPAEAPDLDRRDGSSHAPGNLRIGRTPQKTVFGRRPPATSVPQPARSHATEDSRTDAPMQEWAWFGVQRRPTKLRHGCRAD